MLRGEYHLLVKACKEEFLSVRGTDAVSQGEIRAGRIQAVAIVTAGALIAQAIDGLTNAIEESHAHSN